MRIRTVGTRAVLVEVDDVLAALDLAAYLRAAVPVDEVVPGARTVLLDGVRDRASVEAAVAAWSPGAAPEPPPAVEITVVYDGADLDAVALRWGTDRDGVVARHAAIDFTVAFCGFAPGFAYLTGLPADLVVPRLDRPRSRVPAGSVALAGEWCGVYPVASPGGWRLLGRTDAELWNVERDPPALLTPGTPVRFVPR